MLIIKIKQCKNCGKDFETTCKTQRKIFCSSSCSAKFNNRGRILSEDTKNKLRVSMKQYYKNNAKAKSHLSKQVGKYTKNKFNPKAKSIREYSKRTIRKILTRINLGCSNCGWKDDICDIHHINGRKIEDFDNHNNLSLLCPNCHRLAHRNKLNKKEIKTLAEYLPENWRDYYYG